MGRYIEVRLGCDWPTCDTVAPEGDGTVVEKTVSVDTRQGRAFLLCKKHLDDFEAVVLPLMQAGVKVEAKKRKTVGTTGNGSGTSVDGPSSPSSPSSPRSSSASSSSGSASSEEEPGIVCLEDPCEREGRPVKSNVGLAQHVIKSHGYKNLAAYQEAHGLD